MRLSVILARYALAGPFLVGGTAPAASPAETRAVQGSGGGTAAGGSYALTHTLGQPAVGPAGSATYTLAAGFWNTLNDEPQIAGSFLTTPEDTSLALTLSGDDPENDPLHFTILTSPAHGLLTGTPPNLTYLPATNFFGPDGFTYLVDDGALTSGLATVSITVTPVADTPSVTSATTSENTQTTSGLVVARNPADGAEVTCFKISGLYGGTLYRHDGTTPIANGEFVAFAEGNLGLKFTPATNFYSPLTTFGFSFQAAIAATEAGLGGGSVTASVWVAPAPHTVTVSTSADAGPGSLRQAILDANARGLADTIVLNAGAGPLLLGSPLPAITGSLRLDLGGVTIAGSGLSLASGAVLTLTGTGCLGGLTVVSNATLWLEDCSLEGQVVVETGGLLAGQGRIGDLWVGQGGLLCPGTSPGLIRTDDTTWAGGGTYAWEINQADGSAGADPGWDLLEVNGTLTITADAAHPFLLQISSLSGPPANFNKDSSYSWRMASASAGVSGFATSEFSLNSTGFTGDLGGGAFGLEQATTNLNLTFTANHAPVARAVTYTRAPGVTLKIRISTLLTNADDPDGDSVALCGLSLTSTGGVPLTTNATYIFYNYTGHLSDSFSYTVRDLRSYRAGDTVRTASALVSLSVNGSTGAGWNQVLLQTLPDKNTRVVYAGIPGLRYLIQATSDLTPPILWTTLGAGPITAGLDGRITFDDLTATNFTQRYYRTAQP